MYNALGKRVAVSYPDGSYTVTHIFPRDIFGHRTGIFDDRPSVGWEGWDQWWAQVAGVRLLMGGSTSQVLHTDAVGTTLMVTDQTGAASGDITYDPWGDRTGGGGSNGDAFGGLEYQVNQVLPPSATRDYNPTMGRWMTPDPSGRKAVSLTNPQTWNMYAYATDNPTTLNDPSGLQSCDKLNGTGCNQPAGAMNGTGTGSAQKQSGGWFHKLLAGAAEWAAANGHPLLAGFLTRYMGAGEAEYARANGEIPNTYANGKFRPTHFTRDEPINDAKAAKERYTLPERPTHRATVPEERVPNPRIPDAGPTTEGGGSQVITDEPVPVSPDEIVPLDPGIPVDPIIIDPIP